MLGPDDASGCIILEFRPEGAKLSPINMICVIDINEKENMMDALFKGFGIVSADTDIKHFEPAAEGEIYEILKWTAEGTSSHSVKVGHSALEEEPAGTVILKYSEIEDQYGFVCGLEFREIKAAKDPAIEAIQKKYHACFTAKVKGAI